MRVRTGQPDCLLDGRRKRRKDQASATRRENREAEEQEALFVWAEYQSAAHTELKLYTTYRMRASVVSHTVPRSGQGNEEGRARPLPAGRPGEIPRLIYRDESRPETSRRSTSNGGLKRLNDRVSALWCSGWEQAKEEISEYLNLKGDRKIMITNVEVTKLLQHPDNPRKSIGDVTELAESIKARGILQNLTVVPAENGLYTVIIGHNDSRPRSRRDWQKCPAPWSIWTIRRSCLRCCLKICSALI